jgi:hypothetical protein
MAIINDSNSNPPTKPFDNLTCRIIPIISKIIRPAATLVRIPVRIANPPITSSGVIGNTSSEGNHMLLKKP